MGKYDSCVILFYNNSTFLKCCIRLVQQQYNSYCKYI